MTPPPSASPLAIAGAGIAGLSAAIALKLAGFHVKVFEREPKLGAVGAGIQLGPNATRIMEGWNLDLLGTSYEPEAIELRAAIGGRLLNTIPLRRAARVRYGAPYVTLMRADLQKALLNRAAELEIPIAYGAPVSAADERGADVALEAGGETVVAPALICADGVHSGLRDRLEKKPRHYSAHTVAWRAMTPLEGVPAPLRTAIVVWMAGGMHLVHYPVSGGKQINAILVIDDVYRSDGGEPAPDAAGYLGSRTEGWADVPRSIIGATPGWLPWRMSCVEKWEGGQGRIQYIGDAWHPMRPHLASGGVMAIEDAAVLAGSASASQGDFAEAFRLFRADRTARVWRVVNASARMGRVFHFPPPFDLIRNLAIQAAPGAMLLSQNDWLYGVQREGRPL